MKKQSLHNTIQNRIKTLFKAPDWRKQRFVGAYNLHNKKVSLTIGILLLTGLLPYVHAQFSDNAYVIRTVNIFPTSVESEGWNNVDTLSFQNLGEYALLQEFNKINSATLSDVEDEIVDFGQQQEVLNETPQNVVENESRSTTSSETSSSSVNNINVQDDEIQFGLPLNYLNSKPTPEVESPNTQTTSSEQINVPANETVPEQVEENVDSSTTTVLREVGSMFALAVSSITSLFDGVSTTDEGNDVSVLDIAPQVNEQTENSPLLEAVLIEESVSSATIDVVDVDSASEESTTDVDTPTDQNEVLSPVATSSDEINASEETDIDTVTSEELNSSESDQLEVVPCVDDCTSHTISLSDFGYPLDAGVEVSGAQLRLSFSAKKKETREHIPVFTVRYSTNNGETWSHAGSVVIDDEVSNSINGGYFLYALPEVVNQASLDSLSVQLSYEDDVSVVEELYVESVWLELFTLEAPDVESPTNFLELLNEDGYDENLPTGDDLILPEGEIVNINFTDNNSGETLIIKSDETTYQGLSEVTTYFSVTNTSNDTDEFTLQTYFPEGVGEVRALEVYNQNKPREAVIPEYRPYVYHCEAGWEYSGDYVPSTLDELSRQLADPSSENQNEEVIQSETSTVTPDDVIFDVATSSDVEVQSIDSEDNSVTNTTTTVLNTLPNIAQLLQLSITDMATDTDPIIESVEDTLDVVEEDSVPAYICRNTNVVRKCDELDGANTACLISQQKVADHIVTKYAPGWDEIDVEGGEMPRPGFLRRVVEFIGFGPDKKEIPESFEVRTHTPGTYEINPGETRYFKMDISFPPFTKGEYWIEAIGKSEYGLLDPFWVSDWTYRMPITIDNTSGTTDLTEYQVFFEIGSTLTDFWNNVQSDGGDIRFAQQVSVGNFSNAGTAKNNWFNTAFGGRVPITIPPLTVTEDQVNFPVYVDLSLLDAAFWAGVKSDGGDIRVTTSDGTELPIDMVEINVPAKTGELHFLADTVVAGAANTFYVYYNNAGATGYAAGNPLGSQAVWTGAGYQAVYHFSDDPTTVGNIITDETGLGRNLTVTTAAGATTTGQMGTALNLNGVSGYLSASSWTFPGGDPLITTGMYKMAAADNASLWEWGTGAQPNNIEFRPWYTGAYTNGTGLHYFGVTAGATYSFPRATSTWHSFATIGTTSPAGNNFVYDDGILVETVPQTVGNPTNTDGNGFSVGRNGTVGWWDGMVDELRIATTTRTDERVRLETDNLSNPTNLYSIGSSQIPENAANLNWYSTSWNQRQKFSIPQSKIDANLANFPVYLDLSILGAEFFSLVQNNGSDIRITTGDGVTELPIELVSINTGTKTGELYFKANLFDKAANDFYIYFDNEDSIAYARTATYGSDNVWTNNYKAVYHLEEDVAGSGNPNVYKDSTANQYNGTDNNISNNKAGLFGKGQEFGDSQDDHLSLPKEVLNGVANLTTSWWHTTTNNGAQAILSGAKDNTAAGANEYIAWFNNTTNFQVYYQNAAEDFGLSDTITSHNTGSWNFFAVTGEDAIDEVNFYVNGVGDTENPDPQPIVPLSIATGGLIVGQEQDSLGGGFQANQNFEGQLDELRFSNVVRNATWLKTEYANMNSISTFIATSSSEELNITDFVELDFWLQHFDSTADEADIWVQVANLPAGEETVIYMYYGSSGAVSASDEMATFSYSTSTEIFHVVDNSSASQVSVVSLVDNNQVSLGGGAPVSLNRGERTTFSSFTGASSISVLGPISGTVTNNAGTDGSDTIVPISFATTTQVIPTNRGTEVYYVKSPFATSSVSTYIAAAGAPTQTLTVNKNAVNTFSSTNPGANQAVILQSDNPILVMQRASGGTAQDGVVAYPPTTRDIFGIYSNTIYVTALTTGSDPTAYCSNGASGVQSGITRGEAQTVTTCANGTQFTGNAVRLSGQASPIAALQQADSDGNESTTFWSQMEFGTRYSVSNQAEFVAIVCSPRFGDSDIEVLDTTGSTVDSGTCNAIGNSPGVLRLGNPSTATNQNSAYYAAGYQIVSTNDVPFYVVYEDTTVSGGEDEKNIVGPVQARKFDGITARPTSFGAEEPATTVTFDEDYEQLSFAWYQNTTSQTPTVRWPINPSENAEEGVAISGSGAVDDGDILRLRMNMAVSNATATAQSAAFSLQYGSGTVGQCSAVTNWQDIGDVDSVTSTFAGYNNASLADGTNLSSTTLALSTVAATYEERNYSDFIPNEIGVGEVGEWDWVIKAVDVEINTTYCFRMVRATGEPMTAYTLYPELITVGPPNVPTNMVYFDNEHTTALTPVLEFVTTDIAGDDIQYQVQIDDDPTFSSVDIDKNSTTNFLNFENVTTPADKAPFNSGNLIRFTSPTALASSTTYWWRVRASDPAGSATTSDWSIPTSYTTNQNLQTSEWFQTTGAQFNTNSLTSLTTSAGQISLVGVLGTMVGTPVDFDNAVVGNSWGEADWNDTETAGEIRIQVEYKNGGSWQLVPNTLIPGNSVGTTNAPINLRELNTDIYNQLRLVATFDGTNLSLQDWTIRWGLRVETPVLGDLFDNQKTVDTLPVFDFVSSDPQEDDLEYEISFSTDKTFVTGVSTYNSGVNPGFANQTDGGDTAPFTSGDIITYTTQAGSPFTNGSTYWWRSRAKDPNGDNSWSPWSNPDAFTVDTAVTVSTWFQTTKEQFAEGVLDGAIATTSGSVIVSNEVGEYGKTTVTNGTWTTVNLQRTYNDAVVVASVRYTPLGDAPRSARVRNKTATSFELLVSNSAGISAGTTVVDYLVMELGEWTLDDGGTGKRVIAGTYENVDDVVASTYPASGYGKDVTFSPAFASAPAVIGTISTDNDSSWAVVGLNDGNIRNNAPTASGMGIYLGRGVQTAIHSPEDVDYIVMQTGHGTNNTSEFDADVSGAVHDEAPVTAEAFTSAFSSAPNVVLVQQGAELGGQGGFAGLYAATPPTTNNYYPFIDEDVTADRAHATEQILTLAFENSSGILTRSNSGSLTGTIAGENIIFSDGAGPKYDNFSWNDSTPGASDVVYQMEYEVSTGVYALIPDSVIPSNSAGTSIGPIDLTNVDVDTYPVIRPFATLTCSGGTCPSINDWKLEWSEGVNMSGTLKQYDRLTNVAAGSIRVAVNSSLSPSVGTVTAGVWTLNNVTAFAGDIVTVWVDGAAESAEAVAAFVYDGNGDMNGIELFEQHLSLSADEEGTVTNALLGLYDNLASGDEDIFYNVDAFGNLVVCSVGTCSDANIYVGPGNKYVPSAVTTVTVNVHDFVNDGIVELDTNTFNVSGSWLSYATTSKDASVINLVAVAGTETITSPETPLNFHTISFGSGVGVATFDLPKSLDLSGNLSVVSGTLNRGNSAIFVAGNLTNGATGFWQGTGTTTFDGAGAKTWRDDNLVTQKIGDVVIDGASTFVTAQTNVGAYDVRIGSNDRLTGATGRTIYVGGDWINNGTYVAQSGTVEIVNDNRTYPPVVPGSQDWYSDTNFVSRMMVNVNPSKVPGDLASFPVYVDLSTLGSTFWSQVTSDGRDIRVTSGNGQTELPYDLVRINKTAKTGELHFLANSVSSATTTTFFIYFNNPSATAYIPSETYGSEAVWTGYKAVYHFKDNPTAISNTIYDSTANHLNLLVEEAALATSTGRLGWALKFNGASGVLRNAGFTWNAGDPLVTSGWYKMAAASNESLWQWGTGASPDNIEFRPWYQTTNGLHYFGVTGGATYSQSPRDTVNWLHFVTIGATSTSQDNLVYQNSVEIERVTQTIANPYNNGATGLQIGRNGTVGTINAEVDELRISTKIRNTNWIEAEYNNQYTPTLFYATSSVQSYTPDLVVDKPTHNIKAGGSSFYNLILNDATTTPAFTEPSVVLTGDFTIATGTVALPTGILTIGGSFLNSGYFMHNNAQITFNGAGARTITLGGTEFFNALYNVTFSGTGSWTFTDANATTSNDMIINNGSVIFPSGVLTIGGTLTVNNGGFNANGGTVMFTSIANENIKTKGSSFNTVLFGDSSSTGGWYDIDWGERMVIKVASTSVEGTVNSFPVYVDLASLGNAFWSKVASNGGDIRMTAGNGVTELPVEIVEFDTGTKTGELHFLATTISPVADTNFYLYFDNPDAEKPAVDSTYGAQAVWSGYEAVYHFNEDPTIGTTDVSGNGKDLSPQVGTPAQTAGIIGKALDLSAANIMIGDPDWTWTAGEDLVSSGLFYQSAVDTGALWEFGTVCGTNNGTCLAYLPWYSGTTGYHRFGVTTGDTYTYTRNASIWHHFTTNGRATAGQTNEIYEDSILRGTVLQTVAGQNPTNTGLQIGRYTGGTYMAILVDELRFSSTTKNQAWVTTEHNNLTDVASFYSTSTESYLAVVPSFTLNEAVTDANGDVIIYNANLVAPTSKFTIGGSALNVGGSYNPNNATTTFDSNDTGETVNFGEGAFYNLSFNGVGGGWTVSTTTVLNNASLVTGASFTLNTNTTLSVAGKFSNSFNAAATTWTGSTLVLTGGDYTVTGRLESGDDYAKLVVSGDSDLIIWNSSITNSSVRDTSSLYMPDYGGSNGVLRIYGDYVRTSGTEYWTRDTDFDGTSLTGGSERPVSVEIGRGSSVHFATSTTLRAVGTAGFETTVSAITGIYSLQVNAGTLDVQHVSFQNIGPKGLYLTNGTVVTNLINTDFAIAGGRSGITVDAATVNAQPSKGFSGVNFATSSANGIYEPAWADQVIIKTQHSLITEDHVNFPVYVNLANLGNDFWSGVQSDGRDIRVTTNNGTELPIDLVEINTATKKGELHFLAPIVSATDDTAYYIHFNNPAATAYANDDEYGANNVWVGYEAVYHFNESPVVGITDMTGNGRNLLPTVGVMATTTGLLGTALDTTNSNALIQNLGWSWKPGDDLISSGLYFMTGFDTGALWQFGAGNGTNNGTYLSFMPLYNSTTRGYHYFGVTTGGDYDFARNNAIWHHFTTIGRAGAGENNEFYEDNVLRDSVIQLGSSENPSNTGLRIGAYQTTTYLDIDVDELRFATTTPSVNRMDAEYLNLTNPSAFYSTTSLQTISYNVTTDGVPSTFWAFSSGVGNLYGEDFDNDDGDPGSIQWDNSNFSITISGVVYSDDGVTPATFPVCNGSTEVVTVVLDGVDTYTASCDPIDGSFEVTGITYVSEPKITTYINSEAVTAQTNVSLYRETTGTGVIAGSVMTVSRPPVVDGSVLVLIAGKDDDPVTGTPAGWTAVDILGNTTGDDIATGIWYRVVANAGTEPATYNFPDTDNGEEFNYWMGTLLNVNTAAPIDVASTWTKIQDLTNPAAPQVTTVTNGAFVLSAWYTYIDNEVVPPVYNWETRAKNVIGTANNLNVSSRLMKTAGATGDAVLDGVIATRESQVGQFAFRPAAVPTATGTIVAAAVTKTPLGANSSPFDTVTLRDQRTGFGTVNTAADVVVNRPAVENGDVLIAIMGKEDDYSFTPPTGWVLGADRLEAVGNQMYTGIWYKVITNAGAEPATYNFTNNDTSIEEYSYWLGSFDGVDNTNVFELTPNWSNLQNTSSPAAPTLTTVRNGAYVLSTWYVIDDAAMDMPGSPWTTHAQDLVQANRLLAVAGRSMTTAGATGAATLTGGSVDDVNVGQFALRPAAVSVANSISDMHLYKDRVIVRHGDIVPLSIADMSVFDNDNDSDLPFTATLGSPNNLTVLSGRGLVIWNNRTFTPGGQIVLSGNGSTQANGSLRINQSGTLVANGADGITIGGSLYLATGATFTGASSLVDFTATNPGQSISSAASSTITFYNTSFTGAGGSWAVQTPIISQTNILVSTGTVSGVANVTLNDGSFSGNGTVNLTGGTTLIKKANTFGGTRAWTLNNLTLGASGVAGITTPASTATTSIKGVLTIAAAHFLDANDSVWDLQGNGSPFVENGTFIEDTSTIRYSGATQNIKQTPYYNLIIDTNRGGSVVATAPVTGLQVLNNLTIGAIGTSTLNANTNDPIFSVGKNVFIGTKGTFQSSDTKTLTVNGSWNNDGVFSANGGTVTFSNTVGGATVAAGNSAFATLNVLGSTAYVFTENATATSNMTLNTGTFTLNPGLTLAVGGKFTNSMLNANTTWANTTLSLYSGTAYTVNTKTNGDTYNNIITAANTHARLWNSTTTAVTTNGISSLYSMNDKGVNGNLYIFGDLVSASSDDHWSFANDFDGAVLGAGRQAKVYIEDAGSVSYIGGSLTVLGTSTASTSIEAQGSGPYQLTLGGNSTVGMNYYKVREINSKGLIFTGSSIVNDLSYGDLEVAIANASAMTVGGTVITANPAKEFNFIRLATTTPINAYNVTATGTSNSAWRFVNVIGNLGGEAKDVDPGGDPGYITWQDSAAIINISGTVYSDEGSSVSAACDGVTNNIYLSINGSTFASTSCDGDGAGGGTGVYNFVGINYGLGNTLTVYIDNEPENAVTVTQDPVSSISNFDLYENRVIIKHEGSAPMTIADLEVWDSDDDADVLFDAETAGTDTLVLPANTKLIVWDNKKFAPGGNLTVSGGGSGDAVDGTLELRNGATFTAANGQSHIIGGSLLLGTGSVFTPAQSTVIFTSTVAGRTVDTNGSGFYGLTFNGAGNWTLVDTDITVGDNFTISSGAVTLPTGTTTVTGSFNNTGGSFNASNGLLYMNSAAAGKIVRFGGSDAHNVRFKGTGTWTMSDVNATTTDSFTVTTGTVVLPTGTLTVSNNFKVTGNITHSNGHLKLIGSGGGNTITLSGKDLSSLTIAAGAGDYTLTDASAALLNNLIIKSGSLTVGAGTVSIGGIFDATGGTFVNGNGTLLFNSNNTGEYIDPGTNNLYNLVIAGVGGGWTILDNATTTNNFTLNSGSSFTQNPGTVLSVGGVFTNNIGGPATTWTGSTLVLNSGTEFETNIKTTPTEQYDSLIIGSNTDVSSWNAAATNITVSGTGSWYSQDHAGVDGKLNIYGDYHIPITTEYWSRANDFDGTVLGSPRAVNVAIASSSTITLDGGTLNIIGIANGTSTIANQGTGLYTFKVSSGNLNANNYSFRNLDANGLQFTGNANITSLSNGDFQQAANNTTLISLVSTTLNTNASLSVVNTRFANGGFVSGTNVSLDATTTNSWSFTGALGNLWGEAFDIDGTDECSSIRWDDSQCLLTEQTSYRWRNDDGGEGAAPGTWYDPSWGARQKVRVVNSDASNYTDVAVKLTIPYDSNMQSDFDDLRFTDASGTTTISYWIEKYITGTEAIVWIKTSDLPADGVAEVYMYYNNVSVTTTSDPGNVFNIYDDFEDNNISEYSGNTTKFATAGTFAYGGGYGLDASPNPNDKTVDGIARYDLTVSQGEIIRYMQYIDTSAGSGDEVCTLFGVQSPVTVNQNYAVCLEQFGTDRVSLMRNVENTDSTGVLLSSSTISLSTGWYEVQIDWQTNNKIDVEVYDSAGVLAATTTATDSTYTSGGIGFTFWFQNGGWDSYVSWPRTNTTPAVYFGVEQLNNGASWAAAQDTPVGGFAFDETARLRIAIENTGLPIVNQNFRLEFAPKLSAPSCEAVSAGSFVQVPVLASCGSSAICMTTSANVTNDSPTTDHLVTTAGTFVPGKIVADTSNQTTSMDIGQNSYTELEYAVKLTTNALNDAYCLRVTDGGSSLDSYALLPELTLAFDPIIDTVVLNNGFDISLTPGATTTVLATTTVTDYNGFGDLLSATTTFFKTSVGAACTPDDNNCYIASGSDCSFTNCSGSSCTLICSADFQFHTDSTDSDGGQEWFAFMEVSDTTGANDFGTSMGVELLTLRALDVQNAIGYGTVDINENTGTFNPNVSLLNLGNEAIDVQIAGTDMTDGVSSVIPAAQQHFATSTFDYSSCGSCNTLSVTGTNIEVDLSKPTVTNPPITDDIYWGIAVPFGTASNPHSGINTFTAIAD